MEYQVQSTLKGLKMPGMAACWQTMEETRQADKLSLRDGLQILIQAEKDNRESNRITKLVKEANFRIPAIIEELEISETRGVPADVIMQLSGGEYIKSGSTVLICGATGTGNTHCAVVPKPADRIQVVYIIVDLSNRKIKEDQSFEN